ncbi:MAG: magnesium transporter CorA family protein [Gammaproteobacteria bacterium]|nr:magnesium transporter CorA family protein [Gammaproteobacteria bacterium]
MQILQFTSNSGPSLAGTTPNDDEGDVFFWIDVARSESDWQEQCQRWLKVQLHEHHLADTLNNTHPPYFDATNDYELLIVRTLCPDCPPEAPTTHAVAFIITDRVVLSVRPDNDPLLRGLQQRLLSGQRDAPTSVPMLLYLAIDRITDALLERRNVTSELLSGWQDRLLDPNDQFSDWRALMRLRSQLRRLEVASEAQIDALREWREQTRLVIDSHLSVRLNDIREHLRRLYNHALITQHDIDALVQVFFSSNAQRTNETLQFLAIISAIFLPLNLITALFGTNFTHLPMLSAWYGPLAMLAAMTAVVLGLLLWFRKKRWI